MTKSTRIPAIRYACMHIKFKVTAEHNFKLLSIILSIIGFEHNLQNEHNLLDFGATHKNTIGNLKV